MSDFANVVWGGAAFIALVSAAWVAAGLIVVGCAAWLGHTERSRPWAEDIKLALAALGIHHKEAAHTMGLTPQDLSAQLAGREP